MKAYAILDGGGVKGAALAGCLKAAQELDIEFAGYGGTSAGSIVALLAAVGYQPDELRQIMVDEVSFGDFLDDGGVSLNRLKSAPSRLSKGLKFASGAREAWRNRDLIKRIISQYGLYHGDKLQQFLLKKVQVKLPNLNGQQDITFADLTRQGCKPLKIVASDIRLSSSVIFSDRGGQEINGSVIDAVRASVSFPFVFQPVHLNSRYLVDGGLSSNLPVFLFEEERRTEAFPVPVIAFDLVVPPAPLVSEYGLGNFCVDMLSTSLEASERLLRQSLQGIIYIPVEVPPGIGTLDFDLPAVRREELFTKGHSVTHSYFRNNVPQWKEARTTAERLQALRADPKIINFLLGVMVNDFELQTTATRIRANIMLPSGAEKRIVVYQYGMEKDADCDLELAIDGGCSGQAWSSRQPTFANLEEAKTTFSQWKMTQAEQNKIRADRKAMFSIPIFALTSLAGGGRQRIADFPLLGVLSIDTDTTLQDTKWLEGTKTNEAFVRRGMYWADVFGKLLTERGVDQ